VWEKLANIDRRWIYALMILFIALALLTTVGLAIVTSSATQAAYDA
jgi:hypothetical protein